MTRLRFFLGGVLALTLAINLPVGAADITDHSSESEAPWAGQTETSLHDRGSSRETSLAATNAALDKSEPVADLRHCTHALQLAPANRDAKHACILALERIGAPQLARRLADKNPSILTADEYRRIEGSEAAALVRWGPLETPNEADRFKATDRAIAALDKLIAQWSKEDNASASAILRARFDRMVALRDRMRMKEVVAEYDDLSRQAIAIPSYVLRAVADAYLYLKQPEEARDLYQRVIKDDPKDFDARMGLFYAYVELDDFDSAYRQIDALDADQSIWIYLKGLTEPLPNPSRDAADLAAANARFYGEELSKADRLVSTIENAAPYNPVYRAALGNVYAARGWPRLAQEQDEIGLAMVQNHDVSLETGRASTNLDLQNYRTAEAETADLLQRFPENIEVQKADWLWQVHNMAELRVDATYAFRSATSAQGGDGFGIETQIYSSPIDYNWRLFASEFFAHEAEPNAEGNISLWRTAVGAEYRGDGLTASAAPTYNYFNNEERLGGRADATYSVNDYWEVGGYGEIFSRDTPLRALNAGVTANAFNANATYRASESREVRVDGLLMPFSDGNMRSSLAGTYTERIYTAPHWKIDGIADLAESQNSKDENRLYYNPSRDVLALFGAEITQTLYRRYDLVYEHSLRITSGAYWEQNYGSSPAATVRYEQRVRSNDVLELGLGINFSRQDFDGVPENDVSLFCNLIYRF